MIDWIFDLHQERQISEAKASASRAREKAASVQDEVRVLSARLDRLALLSQAMWELVREQTNLTNEQILAKVREVDLRDGRIDGKLGRKIIDCPACGRMVSSVNRACIYCGVELPDPGLFQTE